MRLYNKISGLAWTNSNVIKRPSVDYFFVGIAKKYKTIIFVRLSVVYISGWLVTDINLPFVKHWMYCVCCKQAAFNCS
jgi:hypothetical protein